MPRYVPTLDEFRLAARHGNLIPVYREILADLETPVSAFKKIDGGNYAFLLESVEGGEKWARYSFLGSNPASVFRCTGREAELRWGEGCERWSVTEDPLVDLGRILSRYRPVAVEGLPRFFGGAVGYLSYDAVRFFERLPDLGREPSGVPDALFLLTDTLLIFDNITHRIKVVSNAFVPEPDDAHLEAAYAEAARKIEAIISSLRRPMGAGLPAPGPRSALEIRPNLAREDFLRGVERCKAYIEAGDAFQIVLSQRLATDTAADPVDIYRALRVINPSPYMFYLRLGDLKLIGSSPEVLVRLEDGRIELRPIAGTRPRGRTEEEDRKLEAEFRKDEKERAEHIMLVDLGRNDVGRVARFGSVEVNELMVTERYSHVMHLVSNVRGQLAAGRDAYDVLRACFPAGTLSGAPKVRAMEIIEELEPSRRGPYGGAVGYVSFSGNMDTCITIRTIQLQAGRATVQVGAGIVADSDPDREYQETWNKARGVLRAIELAEAGLE